MIPVPPVDQPAEVRCLSCSAKVGEVHGPACEFAVPGEPVAEVELRFVTENVPWLREFSRALADAYTQPDGLSICDHLLLGGHQAVPLHMMTWVPGLMICGPCAVTQVPRIREEGILGGALCDSCALVPAAGMISVEAGSLTVWAGLCVRCLRDHRPPAGKPLAEDANAYSQAHHAVFGLTPAPHCLGCSADLGAAHAVACEVAACLTTGRPRLLCPEDHDHGADIWGGYRHGYLEATELGWFATVDQDDPAAPWVRTAQGERGAFPDLNRVFAEAEWDPARLRFFSGEPLQRVIVNDRHKLPNGAVLTITTLIAQQLHHGHWHTLIRTVPEQPSDEELQSAVEMLLADLRAEIDADHPVVAA